MIPLLSEEPIAIWLERNRKNTESCWAEYVVENNVSQNEVVERNTLCKRELIVSLVIQGTRSTDPPRRCRKKKKKKISLVDHPGGNVVTMPSFLQVYGKEWISLSWCILARHLYVINFPDSSPFLPDYRFHRNKKFSRNTTD